jgi:hypothetical protein
MPERLVVYSYIHLSPIVTVLVRPCTVLIQSLSISFDILISLDFLEDFKLAQIFDKTRVSVGNTLAILAKYPTIGCTILK